MKTGKILFWVVMVGLIVLQTSWLSVNWLWLAAVWLGLRQRWGEILVLGLLMDLAGGGRLGVYGLSYLAVAGLSFWLWEFLPIRKKELIKLRWE